MRHQLCKEDKDFFRCLGVHAKLPDEPIVTARQIRERREALARTVS
jgi:hypothetical protein